MHSTLFCVLFLIGVIECIYLAPRCDTCKYTPGEYYLSHHYCSVYIKCWWDNKTPEMFSHDIVCCGNGEVYNGFSWPPGCGRGSGGRGCLRNAYPWCPEDDGQNFACHLFPDPRNASNFKVSDGNGSAISFPCGEGTVFSQKICGCDFPPPDETACSLIIDFDFTLHFQSTSCGHIINGDILGNAFMNDGMICFNRLEQIFFIEHLRTWFQTMRYSFTVSFKFVYEMAALSIGLFSTNCLWRLQGSPVEMMIMDGELHVVLGQGQKFPINTGVALSKDEWYHVAVSYDMGLYTVYVDGMAVYNKTTGIPAARTFTHASLGYVERDMFFIGCFDDFLWYSKALSANEIYDQYENGTRTF